jgi:cell division protein FtsW
MGSVMVFNTSSAEILDRLLETSTHQALVRHFLYLFFGLGISFLVWRIGFETWIKLSPYLLFCITLLLVLVFIPPFGQVRNGAHRWIGFGGLTLQPSEFAKFLIPMAFIERFGALQNSISFQEFFKGMAVLLCPVVLILLEPDNGSTFVILATLLPLFYVAAIPMKYWALPLLCICFVGSVVALQLPYVQQRLHVYLHPELDILGKGHQAHQAKIAAGSGGILGRGAGQSLQKFTYLPEAQNDYIAAIFAEEFGFLGIVLLIVLYMSLAFGGMGIALRSPLREGALLATVLTFLLALQAFLNLGVVSGLLPSKGVNLPFFSQGGSSLIANLIVVTLLINIGNNGKKEKMHCLERRRDRRAPVSSAQSCQATSG